LSNFVLVNRYWLCYNLGIFFYKNTIWLGGMGQEALAHLAQPIGSFPPFEPIPIYYR